jgi:hypothetical protein
MLLPIRNKRAYFSSIIILVGARLAWSTFVGLGFYLKQSVFKVVFQKSVPTQICPLILYISISKG